MVVVVGISLLALCMAVVGVYGMVSYSVGQRIHEIGIRMALGAEPRNVLIQILREGMLPVAAGLFAGVITAAALSGSISTLLFEVKPMNAATYVVATITLLGAAAMSCLIPAIRATRVHPIMALRHD